MRHRPSSVDLIFFASGLAGLGYEIVWTRMFAIGLGHEMPSILAVVAAFFGGLALGSWSLDRVISRSARPGRWYAMLELGIGIWALGTIALIPWLNRIAAELIGTGPTPARLWWWSFALPFLGLLPATTAMGASFPAMERLTTRLQERGAAVGRLYAVNTTGAVAGVLLATFVIVPAVGFRRAIVMFAALSFCCAAATLMGPGRGERDRPEVDHTVHDRPGQLRLAVTLFATGLLGIGYEVLCVRVMGQVLENTVYSFASALSVYLIGTAAGAAIYQRLVPKTSFRLPLVWLAQLLTLACLFGTLVLKDSSAIYEWFRRELGGGTLGSVGAEMGLGLLVFLPATLVMGATFSHLAQTARQRGGGVGAALGINTFGSALAPLLFGVMLLPAAGTKWALALVSLAYLLLIPVGEIRLVRMIPTAVAALLLIALPGSLVLVQAPSGSRIVAYREGVMAAVAVTEDDRRQRLLKVNNRFSMGGTANSFADRRQAHIPMLLHPNPKQVLFLGLGTGITAGAATAHRGATVTGVELLPEVVELLPYFEPANRLDELNQSELVVADARRFIRLADATYDVIIADLFHPARDGAGALYTQEHFEAVRDRLAPDGLFCQWLPLYQLDLEMVRVIVRTFTEVFPHSSAYLAHFNVATPMLGLVGELEPRSYSGDWYRARVDPDPALAAVLTEVALSNELTLLGTLLADDAALRAFAEGAPLNTDDHPRVMFSAPHFTYTKREPSHARLQALLEVWSPPAIERLVPLGDGRSALLVARLQDYIAARDLYLRGAIDARLGRSDAAIGKYLEAVQASPDFRTAYVQCLQEATALAKRRPERARTILRQLQEANPGDPRAGQQLRSLPR